MLLFHDVWGLSLKDFKDGSWRVWNAHSHGRQVVLAVTGTKAWLLGRTHPRVRTRLPVQWVNLGTFTARWLGSKSKHLKRAKGKPITFYDLAIRVT